LYVLSAAFRRLDNHPGSATLRAQALKTGSACGCVGTAADGSRTMAVNLSMPVLVVEDHTATALILRTLLQRLGFSDVDEASDGIAALTKMREEIYALVISDWNMEPMSGYGLLKKIRMDETFAHIRFIMITSDSKAENVIAAGKAGVSGYIVKPFSTEKLKAEIEEAFAK
jgi:two-component system chemotaxis response regulator CheY